MRQRLRKVLEYNNSQIRFSSVQYRSEIFEELPLKLRCEVAMAMHHGALKTITFFQNKDPTFIVAIVPLLKPLQALTDEILFKEGDSPSEIYFLIEGKVVFQLQIEGNTESQLSYLPFKTMLSGSYFGEIGVLFNT